MVSEDFIKIGWHLSLSGTRHFWPLGNHVAANLIKSIEIKYSVLDARSD